MEAYEQKSGYFDSHGNIEEGREAYYHIKGSFYDALGKTDSAEFFFRKELQQGTDYNNQNMAARSLSLLFHRLGKTDSATKYSLYSYQMVDSVYTQMSTRAVARMQAMHNYSRHQRTAQTEKERADQERLRVWILLGVILFSFFVVAFAFHKIRLSKQKAYEAYKAKIVELERVQTDILRLRSNEEELNHLIREKESRMNQLNMEISSLRDRRKSSEKEAAQKLLESPVYQSLHKKADQGVILVEDDWSRLNQLVIELLPGFYQYFMSGQYKLTVNEYRTVVLLRLHVKPKPISFLLGCTPQNVTKISKNILSKFFNTDGTCADLSNQIIKMY